MPLLVLGLVLFLGTHAFTMARGPRAALIGRLGEGGFKGLYSLLSAAGLVLIGVGFYQYRAAGYIPVWEPPVFTRHLALLLMLVSFILLAASRPSHIRAFAKHPMLLAVKVWATAHLISNGDLGSILLFGAFLAWAVAARIAVKRRDRAAGVVAGGPAPQGWRNDVVAVVAGTLVWFVFARWLHMLLIGVSPWPGAA